MNSVIDRRTSLLISFILICCVTLVLSGCRKAADKTPGEETGSKTVEELSGTERQTDRSTALETADTGETHRDREESMTEETTTAARTEETTASTEEETVVPEDRSIGWDSSWKYADHSKIHDSGVKLYYSHSPSRKGMVVAVNPGHGTSGGESVKTLSHPDGTGKVTSGTNGEGDVYSMAISSGMVFNDGTSEADANLSVALLLKDALLEEGFDVLMIREEEDTRLDNIARTVFANNNADCHIALHYDSTESDKGVFYISVPDVASYRNMEPVASHWKEHNALGDALIRGMDRAGVGIFKNGSIQLDLTQTSYSTIPSVDLELGDAASDHSEKAQRKIVDGIVRGLDAYAGQ